MTNERHEKLLSVQRVKNAYSKIVSIIFNKIYVVGTQKIVTSTKNICSNQLSNF